MNTATASAAIKLPSAVVAGNSQWIHVLPAGTVSGKDGRGPYTLDNVFGWFELIDVQAEYTISAAGVVLAFE
jgi:phage I-like protein